MKINSQTLCDNIFNNGIKQGRTKYYPSEFPNLTRVRKIIDVNKLTKKNKNKNKQTKRIRRINKIINRNKKLEQQL